MEIWKEFIGQLLAAFGTIETDLINTAFALLIFAGSLLINQLFGAIMAATSTNVWESFDIKRFLRSILKGILICLGMIFFVLILDLAPILLVRLNMIGTDNNLQQMLTVAEIVVIVVVAFKKNFVEIYAKLKTLFGVNDIITDGVDVNSVDLG